MNNKINLFDTLQNILKDIPGWLKNGIGLVTLLVGFVISYRDEKYLYSVIIFAGVFLYLSASLTYVIFKREKDIFGQPVYKYPLLFRVLALIVLLLVIGTSVVIILSSKGKEYAKFAYYGTPTLIPSLTPTATSSSTPTLTPSPKPISDSLYYMIVYDSSINMDETFHGEKKWQVARNLLVEIMNGLNPRAQYNMAVIGGSNSTDGIDPCNSPASLSLPSFSFRQIAHDLLGNLQPQGGGSFYKAYSLAKNQFQDLPADTIRTLIYITGSSDTCETEDEWKAIQNLISITDSTFNIFSQIIILDDDGIKSRTLAEQFNSLSNENINVQAPQSLSEIQSNGVTLIHIVNNITTYEGDIIASMPTDTPIITAMPTITATLKPGETRVVLPTDTPSNTPTFTPTFTPTSTPIPPTPTLFPEVLYITNIQNDQVLDCSIGKECIINVGIQWVPDSQAQGRYLSVWVRPIPELPDGQGQDYYSQNIPQHQGNGIWIATSCYIGQSSDENGLNFAVYVLVADQPYDSNYPPQLTLPPYITGTSVIVKRGNP